MRKFVLACTLAAGLAVGCAKKEEAPAAPAPAEAPASQPAAPAEAPAAPAEAPAAH